MEHNIDSEIEPYMRSQLFTKLEKQFSGERVDFSTTGGVKIGYPCGRK